MLGKFRWNQVPSNHLGFVNYEAIPSPVVRCMVGEAEVIKLREEYKAKVKWTQTPAVMGRLDSIERQLNYVNDQVLPLREL